MKYKFVANQNMLWEPMIAFLHCIDIGKYYISIVQYCILDQLSRLNKMQFFQIEFFPEFNGKKM